MGQLESDPCFLVWALNVVQWTFEGHVQTPSIFSTWVVLNPWDAHSEEAQRSWAQRQERALRPPSGSLRVAHARWITHTIVVTPLFLLSPPMSTADFVEDAYIYEGTSPYLLFLISNVFQFLAKLLKNAAIHIFVRLLCVRITFFQQIHRSGIIQVKGITFLRLLIDTDKLL